MTDKHKAAVMGAFAADALSLGVHWVYNTNVIDKKVGRIEQYHNPLTSYHKGKQAGDFTHYGDQMLVLLEAIGTAGKFDAVGFANAWRDFFSNYNGYFDKATKTTLENMDASGDLKRSASPSDDLAGASRMAPLVAAYGDDLDTLIRTARAQTAITHNDDRVIQSAEFFARTVYNVLKGRPPLAAVETALEAQADSAIAPLITMGLERRDDNTRETIAEFGQMCSVEAGLPGAVHLVARYADDYRTAMVENVMAGGDSSARGMLAGMVIAAAHGSAAIPDTWQAEMTQGGRIDDLLNQLL
jgi:ADP-ribosylglycohydrolase